MLLAEPRLLHAPEGQLVVRDLKRVDPRVARFELLHSPARMRHVGGPDRRPEPKSRVVGQAQGLVKVLDPPHRQRGPKDLLLPNARVVRHVQEDGRFDEPAFVILLALGPAPAKKHLGPTRDRILDLGLDLGPLGLAVHRSHAAVLVQAVAGLELGNTGDELLEQRVVHAVLHV